jgi:hypothetical protein
MEDMGFIPMNRDNRLIMAIGAIPANMASLLQYDHFFVSSVDNLVSSDSPSKA